MNIEFSDDKEGFVKGKESDNDDIVEEEEVDNDDQGEGDEEGEDVVEVMTKKLWMFYGNLNN